MRFEHFLFYIFSSSATIGFISVISLGLDEYAGADSEALYGSEALFLPDVSDAYQDFDPTTFLTQAGADGDLLPDVSQELDATGAELYMI